MSKFKLKKLRIKLKKPTKKTLVSSKVLIGLLLILTLGGFGYSGYYWYDNSFTDTNRIFYGMIDKSLNTNAVMRTAEQSGANRTETQTVHLSFSPEIALHTTTGLDQITSQNREKSSVETETYGSKESDYVQYTNINIPSTEGEATDYSKVLNTWAKRSGTDESGENQVQFLNEAAFTFVPFGNFPSDKRAELVNMLKEKDVYKVTNTKIEYQNGRPVLSGVVAINPSKFVEVMRKYAEFTGVGNVGQLDPSQYEDRNSFTIQIKIDVISRHLLEIKYPNGDRTEKYYAYGSKRPVVFPKQTISVDELQAKLQQK